MLVNTRLLNSVVVTVGQALYSKQHTSHEHLVYIALLAYIWPPLQLSAPRAPGSAPHPLPPHSPLDTELVSNQG
jgi:hypothetical protein